MLESLFCEDISVEYELKSEKFQDLKLNNWTYVKTQRNSKHYRRGQLKNFLITLRLGYQAQNYAFANDINCVVYVRL